jgi:hypothetical protein
MIFLFEYLGHFTEFVHVELTDKRGQVLVAKVLGEYFLLEFFGMLNADLVITKPSEVLFVFFFLG